MEDEVEGEHEGGEEERLGGGRRQSLGKVQTLTPAHRIGPTYTSACTPPLVSPASHDSSWFSSAAKLSLTAPG